jgi:hypothetical protein
MKAVAGKPDRFIALISAQSVESVVEDHPGD